MTWSVFSAPCLGLCNAVEGRENLKVATGRCKGDYNTEFANAYVRFLLFTKTMLF